MISYQRQEKPTVVSAYDFIVVGAGSSGSVKPVPDIFHLLDTGTAGAAVPVINIEYFSSSGLGKLTSWRLRSEGDVCLSVCCLSVCLVIWLSGCHL